MHRVPTPLARWARAVLATSLVLSACGDDDAPKTCVEQQSCQIRISSGDAQSGVVATALSDEIVVEVLDENLNLAPDIALTWTAPAGGGSISGAAMTGADGRASAEVTTGTVAATRTYTASVDGVPGATVDIAVTAIAGSAQSFLASGGDGQTGLVGTALPQPLALRVVDRYGNGVSGVTVDWSASSGGGMVSSTRSVTDTTGTATVSATLGITPGAQVFDAKPQGLGGNPVSFFATAEVGPATTLVRVSGDAQSGIPGQAVSAGMVVRAVDDYANPVSGVPVSFAVTMGSGASLSVSMGATDAMGEVSTVLTLGPTPGSYEVTATSGSLIGSPLAFTAQAFPPVCSTDGWCWDSPRPQGNNLYGAWQASPTETWVVGDAGTLLRWTGVAWERFDSGTTETLNAVHGSGSSFAVAVGDNGVILTWNGSQWSRSSNLVMVDLESVWMVSPTLGWAVGANGTILAYNGSAWNPTSAATAERLTGVFAASSTEVFIVGEGGTFLRGDGTSLSVVPTGVIDAFNGVWGSSASEVWIVADDDAIYRWDGTNFTVSSPPDTVATNNDLLGVSGIDGQAYAFGLGGRLRTSSGGSWSTAPGVGTGDNLYALAGADTSIIAVGENGAIIRQNTLGRWPSDNGSSVSGINGIWGPSADRAWAVADGGNILSWDGGQWTEVPDLNLPPSLRMRGVHGTSATDAWAVGQQGYLLHWNGTTWVTSPNVAGELNGVWATSSTDVWAVAQDQQAGIIYHYDGTSWSRTYDATVPLYGVYAASANEAWAVGNAGRVYGFDGTGWTQTATIGEVGLLGIRGTSASDVYAWGTRGTVARWDGSTWTTLVTPVTTTIWSILPSTTPGETIAVGENGVILERSSTGSWLRRESGTQNLLYGVWGASPTDLWVVGTTQDDDDISRFRWSGTLLRRTE